MTGHASDARVALRRALGADRSAERDFLTDLVRARSDNPPGDCAPHAERAADLLEKLGFAVERHVVPGGLAREHGMTSVTNLVVRERFGEGGPTVALNAHGDAVPPGEGWSVGPFAAEVREGRMFGRGVAGAKSDVAAYAFALRALKASGLKLNGTVELHLTYDQEVGGYLGPRWLLDKGLSKPDFAVCSGFSYGVVVAHGGCLHVEITVRGRAAHAGRPERGVDALEAANAVMTALYTRRQALRERISTVPGIGNATLTIGMIEGGINTNVVPDRITLRVDRRIIPEEDPGVVEGVMRTLVTQTVENYEGASCDVRRLFVANPLRPTPASEQLGRTIAVRAREAFGEPIRLHGLPLCADARHYAAFGVPTVLYGAGPRSIEAAGTHAPDENIRLDDLDKATEVVALSVVDLFAAR